MEMRAIFLFPMRHENTISPHNFGVQNYRENKNKHFKNQKIKISNLTKSPHIKSPKFRIP